MPSRGGAGPHLEELLLDAAFTCVCDGGTSPLPHLHHLPPRRCNIQDYIWHKGARCEAVVTEFQVMCLAVGASALVLLLLFMIVVCFAKKIHMLKTENKKLRKRR